MEVLEFQSSLRRKPARPGTAWTFALHYAGLLEALVILAIPHGDVSTSERGAGRPGG